NGNMMVAKTTFPGSDNIQDVGKNLTYHRRYDGMGILGVFPRGEDNDANDDGVRVSQSGPRANTRPTPPPVQERPRAEPQGQASGMSRRHVDAAGPHAQAQAERAKLHQPAPAPKPKSEPPPPPATEVITEDGEVIQLNELPPDPGPA